MSGSSGPTNPDGIVGNLNLDDPSEPFTRRSWRYRARMAMRTAREAIGDDPAFLPIVLRATPTGTARRLGPTTRLVIEGFPRSGNTFAYFAVKHAGGPDYPLSSHVHTPSAVRAAVALHIPTVVVVRPPLATITSLLIAAPHVPFHRAIGEWIHHHEQIWPYRDGYVIATFADVTADMGVVIDRVNERFATDVPRFDATPAHTEEVFAMIEKNHQDLHGGTENVVPRPSEARKAERVWLEEQLAAPRYADGLARADEVYGWFSAAR